MEIYHLTNETIDMLSEQLGQLYQEGGCTKREITRAKLLLEAALLKYQSRFGEEIEVYFRVYRIFSQMRFCLRLRAPSFDPFTLEENPMAHMIQSIMTTFEGAMPLWRYRNMEDEIVFSLRKKARLDNLAKIAIAIAASLLLGIAARLLLPQAELAAFVNDYLHPLSNAYAGLFCVMAVIMTFFGFTLGIVQIGDLASAGALGGRILRRFYLMMAAIVVVLTVPLLPFVKLSGQGTIEVAAKSIYDILIGFIPTNFISPFLNFNTMHIMIIGLMFGFSLLVMGQKGETLVKLFDEGNMVAVYTNDFLNRFIFLYVGAEIFAIITTSEFSKLVGAGKMVIAILVGELLIFIFYAFRGCLKCRVPIREYLQKLMPTFLVCLSSANLSAAFQALMDSLTALDVENSTFNISSNLGSVVFQPGCAFMLVASSVFMAEAYGVEISFLWVVTAILLSIILIAAVPNIPGAAVSVFTLLFTQLGLPGEALSFMIAIYAVLQFVTVGVDGWCLMGEIACMDRDEKKRAGA